MISKLILIAVIAQICVATHIHKESAELRISGGEKTDTTAVKHVAFISLSAVNPRLSYKIKRCGGSLLTVSHVLTAASCLKCDMKIRNIIVGAAKPLANERTQQTLYPERVYFHESYNVPAGANDVAIIKVENKATLNGNVALVKLPKLMGLDYKGQKATAYGWGNLQETPSVDPTNELHKVDLQVISAEDCKKKYNRGNIPENDMCTGSSGKKGICTGDAGGPLMYNGEQIGIASRSANSNAKCDADNPSVFVKVSNYLLWIDQIIANDTAIFDKPKPKLY